MVCFCLGSPFDTSTLAFCWAAVPATLPDGFSGLIILVLASLMALFFSAVVILVVAFDAFTLAACSAAVFCVLTELGACCWVTACTSFCFSAIGALRSTICAAAPEANTATVEIAIHCFMSSLQTNGAVRKRPAPSLQCEERDYGVAFFCSSLESSFWPSFVFSSVLAFGCPFDSATLAFCCAAVPATLPDGFSGLIICLLASLMALFFSAVVIFAVSFDFAVFAAASLAVWAPVVEAAAASVVDLTSACRSFAVGFAGAAGGGAGGCE